MTAPTTSGWSIFAGWDLHPLESAAFHGAHPLQPVTGSSYRDIENSDFVSIAILRTP
jgi:hypothetical protein